MNYEELTKRTAEAADMDDAEVQRVLKCFFGVLTDNLMSEDIIELQHDFGRFVLTDREGTVTGKNSEQMKKATRKMVFRPSSYVKGLIKQSDADYIAMLRKNGKNAHADKMEQRFIAEGRL
ncbi:MAG: HU family DNA-binding protein [Oscillospiraceae bacterium]|nr:HU family DNA-binding protein [Oscillospiraceae bacterium]